MEDKKIVTVVKVSKPSFDCPHCGADVDGWAVDPRGRDDVCDACEKPYTVAADAQLKID